MGAILYQGGANDPPYPLSIGDGRAGILLVFVRGYGCAINLKADLTVT